MHASIAHCISTFPWQQGQGCTSPCRAEDSPAPHTLHLDLWANDVGGNGAQALAGLKEAPVLHTLHLDLGGSKGRKHLHCAFCN